MLRRKQSVRDKLNEYGNTICKAWLRCKESEKAVLDAYDQYLSIASLWSYVEYFLSCAGRIQLSAKCIVKAVQPIYFGRERQAVFHCLVIALKVLGYWTEVKGLKIDTCLSDRALNVLKFQLNGKEGAGREVLPSRNFIKRWTSIEQRARENRPTLCMHF